MGILIALVLLAIVASLAAALFFMLKGQRSDDESPRRSSPIVRALALRVALSIVLFLGLLLAWKAGLIQPTGIPPGA